MPSSPFSQLNLPHDDIPPKPVELISGFPVSLALQSELVLVFITLLCGAQVADMGDCTNILHANVPDLKPQSCLRLLFQCTMCHCHPEAPIVMFWLVTGSQSVFSPHIEYPCATHFLPPNCNVQKHQEPLTIYRYLHLCSPKKTTTPRLTPLIPPTSPNFTAVPSMMHMETTSSAVSSTTKPWPTMSFALLTSQRGLCVFVFCPQANQDIIDN